MAGRGRSAPSTSRCFRSATASTHYNTGNNVYALTDVGDDAFYQTIWDSGGTDTISYGGVLDARIDLTAATLDYSPTGGGVVSFLQRPGTMPASAEIKGGYTIANGVVIENATGGSGDDVLIGNSAANVLTGNGGNDMLIGRAGNDMLSGGAGVDNGHRRRWHRRRDAGRRRRHLRGRSRGNQVAT